MDIEKRNNIHISGKGEKTIVFSHGYGCDQSMWRYIAPAFEENYRILLYDLVGSGNSDISAYSMEKYNKLHGYAGDLIEILDGQELKEVIFVGHSVSGMIGLLASIRRPELFEQLILICPSARYMNDDGYEVGFSSNDLHEMLDTLDHNFVGWAGNISPAVMLNPNKPELTEELQASFCNQDPLVARHFARVTFLSDHRSALDQVSKPCLILHAKDDFISPQAAGQYVHKHIRNSSLLTLDALGHYPHLSAPQETTQAILEYLNSKIPDKADA